MTWLYGTKHAGYNWQPNRYADYAQPQDAPCLQLMLTTSNQSVRVVLHLILQTSVVSAVPAIHV